MSESLFGKTEEYMKTEEEPANSQAVSAQPAKKKGVGLWVWFIAIVVIVLIIIASSS